MSIPVFKRNPDGTGWSGRISYNWLGLRKHDLSFELAENIIPEIDFLYQRFGVSSALFINPQKIPQVRFMESLYEFLYGCSLSELLEPDTSEDLQLTVPRNKWKKGPKEWNPNNVETMDWDLFCATYYVFLCSNNDFYTQPWVSLSAILRILQSNSQILHDLLSKNGRSTDLTEFWETIYDGLQEKVILNLEEATCYIAFHSLHQLKALFPEDKYKVLEQKCCEFVDVSARDRIASLNEKRYAAKELVDFDIETLFFYSEYFEVDAAQATKEYVSSTMFSLLSTKGDIFLENNYIIEADDIYAAALKYAQTSSQRELITSKRDKIASAVNGARDERAREQAIAQLKREKEQEQRKRKEARSDAVARVMAILVLACIAAIVVFGALLLFGVAKELSRIVLLGSLGVIVLIGLFCAIDAVYRKFKK